MNVAQVKTIAREQGIVVGRLRKAELIQAIQRSENNYPCYNTGQGASCDQSSCLWREDCK